MILGEYLKTHAGKGIGDCTDEELYHALLGMTQELASQKVDGAGKKKLSIFQQNF